MTAAAAAAAALVLALASSATADWILTTEYEPCGPSSASFYYADELVPATLPGEPRQCITYSPTLSGYYELSGSKAQALSYMCRGTPSCAANLCVRADDGTNLFNSDLVPTRCDRMFTVVSEAAALSVGDVAGVLNRTVRFGGRAVSAYAVTAFTASQSKCAGSLVSASITPIFEECTQYSADRYVKTLLNPQQGKMNLTLCASSTCTTECYGEIEMDMPPRKPASSSTTASSSDAGSVCKSEAGGPGFRDMLLEAAVAVANTSFFAAGEPAKNASPSGTPSKDANGSATGSANPSSSSSSSSSSSGLSAGVIAMLVIAAAVVAIVGVAFLSARAKRNAQMAKAKDAEAGVASRSVGAGAGAGTATAASAVAASAAAGPVLAHSDGDSDSDSSSDSDRRSNDRDAASQTSDDVASIDDKSSITAQV